MAEEIRFFSTLGAARTVRIIRLSDLYVYDNNASAFAAAPTWANSLIAATEKIAIKSGCYTIDLALVAGSYFILVYNGVAPADGATPLTGFVYDWNGSSTITQQTISAQVADKTGYVLSGLTATSAGKLDDMLDGTGADITADITGTVSALAALLEADVVLVTTTTPWELHYRAKGTATVLFKKQLKDSAGNNITAAGVVVGQHIHTA